jgi:hypothetical protein
MNHPWSESAVTAFAARFEQCRVSKQEWTHEAHLVTGFWYVRTLGPDGALQKMRTTIRRHNEAVGTPNTDTGGYHETLTRLYLGAIDQHIQRNAALTFESCLAKLLASPMASSAWPLTHYTKERLFSVDARKVWLEPDLSQGH